jgi:HlyD family secretion protein
MATLQKGIADAAVTAPVGGIVTERLVEAGELVRPGTPLLTITDLDRVWANVYVDEPMVPRLRLGQAATLFTDAGGDGIAGTITYISPSAEFTPRNVQTADDRSKLVYRVKVSVDNRAGVLKAGMPIEAEIPVIP